MRAHVERLAASLLGPRDVLVDESSPTGIARGLRGRAFCPTPRALAILERAGADPEPHPDVEVLRRVNSRAFASSLGATMLGAAFVTELGIARAVLHAEPPIGNGWRVKHAFGMAGRNQRVVVPSSIDQAALAFVRDGGRRGGVQIEPNVAIEAEYALHGFIGEDGALALGALVRQRCDARGAWMATEPIARSRSARRHRRSDGGGGTARGRRARRGWLLRPLRSRRLHVSRSRRSPPPAASQRDQRALFDGVRDRFRRGPCRHGLRCQTCRGQ